MEDREYLERCREISKQIIANAESYRAKYGNNYIAFDICSREELGHDENRFSLERKIRKNFSRRDIFITNIDRIINPAEVEMPSPERENEK